MPEQVFILSKLRFSTIYRSFQVEQLQLDSMIMTENRILTGNGSRERETSGNVPAETTDMDSENVNEEELDLTVSSALNSKEIS